MSSGLIFIFKALIWYCVIFIYRDLASKNVSVSTILLDFDTINFDDEIIEKEFVLIQRVDTYRRNKKKAPRKVLKIREEEDAKHERDKILKSRYNDVVKEIGKRIKWDYEIENDENNNIGNKNANKNNEDENENENDEERSRTKNRALAITHSLLSTYPQLLYEWKYKCTSIVIVYGV